MRPAAPNRAPDPRAAAPTAGHDRSPGRTPASSARGLGRGGCQYLIVDPRDGTCVHHWAITIRNGTAEYDARVPYVFGDKITIGGWVIDTSELPPLRPGPS